MSIAKTYVEENIQSFFEARLSKKKQLEKDFKEHDFGDKNETAFFKKAAEIIQQKASAKSKESEGIPYTVADIMHILKSLKEDKEYMQTIKTPQQLAAAAIQTYREVVEIAVLIARTSRTKSDYETKLAYEVGNRKQLADAIKTALKTISALTGKKFLVESTSDAHTLALRKVLNYITSKSGIVSQELKKIEKDRDSKNAKDKALAISKMKNLEDRVGHKSAEKIETAFEIVKEHSGAGALTWPTLNVKLERDDKYKSLFKYLDAYVAGERKSEAKKFLSQFKNKTKAETRRKLLLSSQFRRQLKEAISENKLDTGFGGDFKISDLQKLAKKLMRNNPQYVAELKKEGIKETAIDEIVGLLTTHIHYGPYEVRSE